MEIDLSGGTLSNSGLIETTTGVLELRDAVVENAGGTIRGRLSSQFDFTNVTVRDGLLDIQGTSFGTMTGTNELRDLTQHGTLTALAGSVVNVFGALSHTGVFRAQDGVRIVHNASTASAPLLSGTGTLVLDGPNTVMVADAAARNDLMHTVEGEGLFGVSFHVNVGLIDANKPGATLRYEPIDEVQKVGTLRASNGGTLRFEQAVVGRSQTIANVNVIEALDASFVDIYDTFVSGGTLRTAGTGVIRADTFASMADTTIDGHVHVLPGSQLILSGSTPHKGLIEVSSGATLRLDPSAMRTAGLSGDGRAVLLGPSSRLVVATDAGLGPQYVVAGQGGIAVAIFTNNGLIDANVPGAELSFESNEFVVNHGTMRASNGGTLRLKPIRGNLTSTGLIEAAAGSTVLLQDVTIVSGRVEANGGTLMGRGTIRTDVHAAGAIAPGLGTGLLTIEGAYNETTANTLRIELNGTGAGSTHDLLRVQGTAALAGDLSVEVLAGVLPNLGANSVFTVVDADVITGAFANVASGLRLQSTDDLWSFLVHYGAASPFDTTNIVLSDFRIVPEPGTLVLVLIVFVGSRSPRRSACHSRAVPQDYNMEVEWSPGSRKENAHAI